MAAPKKGVTEPITICPFTGKLIDIKFSPRTGTYMAVGPFWNSKLYKDKQELMWELSHRMGVAPQFPKKVVVKVKHLEEPDPNPNADLVVQDPFGDKKI